jgi:hypothetical protein
MYICGFIASSSEMIDINIDICYNFIDIVIENKL